MLLVISYVGSHLKLLWMSWYKSIKQLINNLKLIIKKDFCVMNGGFNGVEYYSNDFILIVMSKYICFYHLNTISFEFLYMIVSQTLYLLLIHL